MRKTFGEISRGLFKFDKNPIFEIQAFLLLFLALDVVFGGLHILTKIDVLADRRFFLDFDGGFGERFQYFKAVMSGLFLTALAWRSKSVVFLWWASLNFYLFFDDLFRFHERIGGMMLGSYLDFPLIKGYHLGQVIFAFSIAGMGLGIMFFLWKRADVYEQRISAGFLCILGFLGFSAVGVDFVESVLASGVWQDIAVLVEEIGEHLAMTLMVWWSARAFFKRIRGIPPWLEVS